MVHARDNDGLNLDKNSEDGKNGWLWEMLKKRTGLIHLNE